MPVRQFVLALVLGRTATRGPLAVDHVDDAREGTGCPECSLHDQSSVSWGGRICTSISSSCAQRKGDRARAPFGARFEVAATSISAIWTYQLRWHPTQCTAATRHRNDPRWRKRRGPHRQSSTARRTASFRARITNSICCPSPTRSSVRTPRTADSTCNTSGSGTRTELSPSLLRSPDRLTAAARHLATRCEPPEWRSSHVP
jgi:hypothetical protein